MGLKLPMPPQELTRNDAWLLVLQRVDILSLLTLWKTSKSLRALISKHETTICTQVAANTFPPHIVERLKKSPDEPASLEWAEDLVPRFLASAAVDRVRFRMVDGPQPRYVRCGVAAADRQGDALRERVAHGWRVAMRLSGVLRAAERDPKHTLDRKPKSWRSRLPEMHGKGVFAGGRGKARERFEFQTPMFKIVRRFFGGLTYADLHALRLLNWYLAESVSRIMLDEEISSEKLLEVEQLSMRDMEYWVLAELCRDGPRLYWHQWWEDRDEVVASSIANRVAEELRNCDKDELKLGIQLGTSIRHLARPPGLPQSATDYIGYMKSFCEHVYKPPISETALADPALERLAYWADAHPHQENPTHTYVHTEARTRNAAFCFWE